MDRIIVIFYIISFLYFVILGTYNWFYGNQVKKAKSLFGLSSPGKVQQIITINATISYVIAIFILALTLLVTINNKN